MSHTLFCQFFENNFKEITSARSQPSRGGNVLLFRMPHSIAIGYLGVWSPGKKKLHQCFQDQYSSCPSFIVFVTGNSGKAVLQYRDGFGTVDNYFHDLFSYSLISWYPVIFLKIFLTTKYRELVQASSEIVTKIQQ